MVFGLFASNIIVTVKFIAIGPYNQIYCLMHMVVYIQTYYKLILP